MQLRPFAPTSLSPLSDVVPPPPHGGALPPPHPGPRWGAAGGPPSGGGYPLIHGEPPRRNRRVVWIVLGALAGVIVLIGAIAAVVGNESSTTTSPVTASPTISQAGGTPTAITEPSSTTTEQLLQGPVDILDSFAFTEAVDVTWAGGGLTMNVTGTYLATGSQECTLSLTMNGSTFAARVVVIGGQAWYDPGDGRFVATTPSDSQVTGVLSACPSSHEMWGEDFEAAPPGGVDTVLDGLPVVQYDVAEMAGSWSQFFGLPTGLTAQTMVVYASQDRTWVAGMQATVTGSADSFRSYMGLPPSDVTSDCTMTLDLRVQRPNDTTLTVVAPM